MVTNLLSRMNERRILEHVRQNGPSSRASMARANGMSAPTVSKAVAALVRRGFLEESEETAQAFGRPGKLIRLCDRGASVVGVVVDAARGWAARARLDGVWRPEDAREFSIPDSYQELLELLGKEIRGLAGGKGGVRGVGLSVPGLLDGTRGRTLISPNLGILNDHALAADLSRITGLPCVARQESHALCLGERMYGAAQGLSDFVMLDVTTGLGVGIVSGGRLLTGSLGLAGELGHVTVEMNGERCGCGNRGCLETVATDSAFRRGISRQIRRRVSMREALEALRRPEPGTELLLERTLDYLAVGIAAVINIFNPSTLFLHGELVGSDPALFEEAILRARRRSLKPSFEGCRILQSRGSKKLGAVASIALHFAEEIAPEAAAFVDASESEKEALNSVQ